MSWGGILQIVVAFGLASTFLSGCSTSSETDDNTAFANTDDALNLTANVEYFSSDQALAEGKAYFRAQSYGNATHAFRRAVELEPKDREAWLGLAASYDRLRRFDLADRAYQQFAKLSPLTYQYHNNLGYSYLLRGEIRKARAEFLKAYELAPDNPVVANNLKLLGSSSKTVVR